MAKKQVKSKASSAKAKVAKSAKKAPIRKGGKSQLVEPKVVKDSDVDPHHQWHRPL